MPDNDHTSPQDFLNKMDAGDYDGQLVNELKKISREQLEEVARVLMERDAKRQR